MSATPSRRWFRFSLRTLFVVVTVIAVVAAWFGYNLNWIRQRHKYDRWWIYGHMQWGLAPGECPDAPWPIRLFGESGQRYIDVVIERVGTPRDLTAEEIKEIEHFKRLFPEAEYVNVDVTWRH